MTPGLEASDPTQEAGSQPAKGQADGGRKKDVRGFIGVGLRDLSESDMATPAARRFLIYEIQRLDEEAAGLKEVEARYQDLRVETATLREKSTKNARYEVLIFFATTAGAAGLGAAPSFISVAQVASTGWAIVVISAVLLVGAVLSRIIR